MKKYPDKVYEGINNNSDTWGMCCSENMARKCAEDWYDNHGGKREIILERFANIFLNIYSFIIKGFIIFLILLSLYGIYLAYFL